MSTRPLLYALGALIIGAGLSPATPAIGAGRMTLFCQKRYLAVTDGSLYCDWFSSLAAACRLPDYGDSGIRKGEIVSGPTDIKKCPDGHEVIKVSHN